MNSARISSSSDAPKAHQADVPLSDRCALSTACADVTRRAEAERSGAEEGRRPLTSRRKGRCYRAQALRAIEEFILYEIECQRPNCYYIGITKNFKTRARQHRSGGGSVFVKLCGVKSIKAKAKFESEHDAKLAERNLVLKLRAEDKIVCGAGWTNAAAVLRGEYKKT